MRIIRTRRTFWESPSCQEITRKLLEWLYKWSFLTLIKTNIALPAYPSIHSSVHALFYSYNWHTLVFHDLFFVEIKIMNPMQSRTIFHYFYCIISCGLYFWNFVYSYSFIFIFIHCSFINLFIYSSNFASALFFTCAPLKPFFIVPESILPCILFLPPYSMETCHRMCTFGKDEQFQNADSALQTSVSWASWAVREKGHWLKSLSRYFN